MMRRRFKWDDFRIGVFLEWMDKGTVNVPFINRGYKWSIPKNIVPYMDTLFNGRLSGCLTLWETDQSKKRVPSCQLDQDKNVRPNKLVLDGGNRTRSLWSIRYNKPIPGADGAIGEKGVKISFHPLTGVFRKTSKKVLNETGWIHDFNPVWDIKDPSKIFDHSEKITKDFLSTNYKDSQYNVLKEEDKLKIRKNIETLIEIMFLDFHSSVLPEFITLDEALQTFRDINSTGVRVNTIDALLSMLFGDSEETGHSIKEFDENNEQKCKTDVRAMRLNAVDILLVSLGILGKDLHKTSRLVEIYENCPKEVFCQLVDFVIDEHNYLDFESNVVQRAGYVGKVTGNMIFSGIYTLYLDAKKNHGFKSEDIHGIFRKLFFVVGILPKEFSGNITDNLAKLLKKLKNAKDLNEYKYIFNDFINELKEDNMRDLADKLLEDTCKNSKYLNMLKAVAVINNAKLLFTNNYVANNLKLLHVHHLHPLNNDFYDEPISLKLLDSIMNTVFTSRSKNLGIGNSLIETYFSKELALNKEDNDLQLELYGLDESWGEGIKDDDSLLARLEERAQRIEVLVEKTIEGLDK